jgi:hypothetical protein
MLEKPQRQTFPPSLHQGTGRLHNVPRMIGSHASGMWVIELLQTEREHDFKRCGSADESIVCARACRWKRGCFHLG